MKFGLYILELLEIFNMQKLLKMYKNSRNPFFAMKRFFLLNPYWKDVFRGISNEKC